MPPNTKEYNKQYHEKNKAYRKEYGKQWREKNKEYMKEYRKKYPGAGYLREWRKTPKGRRNQKISDWRTYGIQCNDEWGEVYEWYSNTTNCNICDKLFVKSIDKCLDHDHNLQGYNLRGILCKKCNNFSNEL